MSVLDARKGGMEGSAAGEGRHSSLSRFVQFVLVGASGLVVNQAAFWVFHDRLGIFAGLAAVLSTQLSTVWNFALVERFVFKGTDLHRLRRFGWWWVMNNAWLLIRIPLMYLLVNQLGVSDLWSNFIGLCAMTLVRFSISDRLIWSEETETPEADVEAALKVSHRYDIHGIVKIASESPLPELSRFEVAALDGPADLEITISNKGFGGFRMHATVEEEDETVTYVEHLGGLGFAARIELGTPVRIQASRLLRLSPHVLYTNVVEPLLRWVLVRKGRILAHAACLQIDGRGVLITARTDTGKTTTCLKSIKEHGSGFVSDDMVIVDPEGGALSFPKPLTISAHTLAAVEGNPLSLRRRAWLQVQSRLHSRSGRSAGLALSRANLPVATMNAIVQMIIPPPKFQIDELVPQAQLVGSLQLDRLIVIERGKAVVQELDAETAFEILSDNTEDAYGFPPYPRIAHALANGEANVEREIRRSMLVELSSTLVRSPDRSWFELLPMLADGSLTPASGTADDDAFDGTLLDLTEDGGQPVAVIGGAANRDGSSVGAGGLGAQDDPAIAGLSPEGTTRVWET
jgi:dolichol-phosphate mannosyltransferase